MGFEDGSISFGFAPADSSRRSDLLGQLKHWLILEIAPNL